MLGVLICVQFVISVEVLAIMGIATGVTIIVAAAGSPRRIRSTAPYAVRALSTSIVVAAVLLAGPTWYLLAGPRHISGVPFAAAGTVANGRLFHLWSAGQSSAGFPIPGSSAAVVVGPPDDYLGLGVMGLVLAALIVARRRALTWVLVAVAAVCTVLSWGAGLWLSPTHEVVGWWLPWHIITEVPVLRNVVPVRFAIFTDLACALLIAIGVDTASRWDRFGRRPGLSIEDRAEPIPATGSDRTRKGRGVNNAFRAIVVGAVALAFVPQWLTYQVPIAAQKVVLPKWFATEGRRIAPGSTVLTYPFPMSATLVSQPMVWQAVDGMRFRLAGGYAKVPGASGTALTTGTSGSAIRSLFDLTTGSGAPGSIPTSAGQLESLRLAIRRWRVSDVVVNDIGALPLQTSAVFTAIMTRMPEVSHGSWVWKIATTDRGAPFSAVNAAPALRQCLHLADRGVFVADKGTVGQKENACVIEQLAAPIGHGYWLVNGEGDVMVYGDAMSYGSEAGVRLNAPMVGMIPTPDRRGYWLVAADGGVFTFGDARFYGSEGAERISSPVTAMASTPNGYGYWLVDKRGGVTRFGRALLYGSEAGNPLNAPVVGISSTPDGHGYWLVAADGGVFTFGDARFFGSEGDLSVNSPVVGMAPTPTGKGYWLVDAKGRVDAFGDARSYGSLRNTPLNAPVVSISSTPDGHGYWLVSADGGVFTFGDAGFFGSKGSERFGAPVVGGTP